MLLDTLKNSGLKTKIGAGLIKDSLKEIFNNLDDTKQGGAVLLGVKSPVIKAHGSSNDEAIFNAIRQATTVVTAGVVQDAVNYFQN